LLDRVTAIEYKMVEMFGENWEEEEEDDY